MTQRRENPGSDSFVHLYVHSEFSLLDGLSRIPEMTQRAGPRHACAGAHRPRQHLRGHPVLRRGEEVRHQAIIGVEAYLVPRGMTVGDGKAAADYHHMILLVRDDIGFRNLLALTTAAHLDGYYYKPRIDK